MCQDELDSIEMQCVGGQETTGAESMFEEDMIFQVYWLYAAILKYGWLCYLFDGTEKMEKSSEGMDVKVRTFVQVHTFLVGVTKTLSES